VLFRSSFGVNAEVMSADFATGLDLFADVLLNSTFPADALERERQIQIASIRAQKDQILKSASNAMRRALFGGTGYGLDVLGTEESAAGIRVADLKAFQRKFAVPNNCVLAIFGDVNMPALKASVKKYFANWKPNPAVDSFDSKFGMQNPKLTGSKRVDETRDKKQAVVVIGFPATTLDNPDHYGLELVQEACSDLGSRLFLRVREQLGLAYYVGAQHFPGLAPGYFAFYAGTMPEQVGQEEKELLREAELLRLDGLTEAELKRAKAKIVGQKKIARQDIGTLAMTAALDELYGLGYAHIDTEDAFYAAVTLDEIRAVARKYLKPDALVVSVVKPDQAPAAAQAST
jgi:zinc protease